MKGKFKNTGVSSSGQSQMVGPSKPIQAMVDEDIIWPCHLPLMLLLWHWSGWDLTWILGSSMWWCGTFGESESIIHWKLINVHWDWSISPKLSKVKVTDEGTYRCHIPALSTSSVELVVGEWTFHTRLYTLYITYFHTSGKTDIYLLDVLVVGWREGTHQRKSPLWNNI